MGHPPCRAAPSCSGGASASGPAALQQIKRLPHAAASTFVQTVRRVFTWSLTLGKAPGSPLARPRLGGVTSRAVDVTAGGLSRAARTVRVQDARGRLMAVLLGGVERGVVEDEIVHARATLQKGVHDAQLP